MALSLVPEEAMMKFKLWLCRWFGHGGNLLVVARQHRSTLAYCFRCHAWEQCDLPEAWVQ